MEWNWVIFHIFLSISVKRNSKLAHTYYHLLLEYLIINVVRNVDHDTYILRKGPLSNYCCFWKLVFCFLTHSFNKWVNRTKRAASFWTRTIKMSRTKRIRSSSSDDMANGAEADPLVISSLKTSLNASFTKFRSYGTSDLSWLSSFNCATVFLLSSTARPQSNWYWRSCWFWNGQKK